MGSGWHEWPLMIFTVFGQCVAGGFYRSGFGAAQRRPASRSPAACYRLHVWLMGADGHWLYRLYAPSWFTDARL